MKRFVDELVIRSGTCLLMSAVSSSFGGKSAAEVGNAACRSRNTSSAGTVERTSVRRESRRKSTRLPRAGTA